MLIFLTGFMGAGKTTVGELLSQILEVPFLDTDTLIEAKENRTVAELFATKGESYFRESEKSLLNELPAMAVVATGGGMGGNEEMLDLMKLLGKTCYLKVPFEEIEERLSESPGERPLLKNKNLRDLFNEREPVYMKSDIVVDGVGQPGDVAARISEKLFT